MADDGGQGGAAPAASMTGTEEAGSVAGQREPMAAGARQIRGSALLLTGTFLASAVDFVSQVVLVRYLSKDAFGAWSYALAIVALFSGIAQYEMRNAASRFIPVYLERGEPRKLLGTIWLAIGVAAGLGLLIAVGMVVAIDTLGLRPTADPRALGLLVVVAALVPIQAVDNVFTGLFASFGASGTIFRRQSILGPALRFGLVVLLVGLGAGVDFLAAGYVVASGLGILLYLASFGRVLRAHGLEPRVAGGWEVPFREVLGFATPMLTTTLVWILMESSDAILLGFFFDSRAVANFRVVLPLAHLNAIVSAVFAVLYLPLAASFMERRDPAALRELYWRTAFWMTVLTFPVLILTTIFASPVTATLYGQAYAASAPILVLVALGYFFNTALGFNGLTVKVHGRLRYTVATDVTAAIANVAINLLLIPRLGPIGAAIGTSATLVLHNLLKHAGLVRFTSIGPFDRRYLRGYAALAGLALVCVVAAIVLPPSLLVAVLFAGGAGLAGLWLTRGVLQIWTTFPELARAPMPGALRRLIGAPEVAVPAADPPSPAPREVP